MQVGLRVRVRASENLEGSQKIRPSVLGVGSSAMPCHAMLCQANSTYSTSRPKIGAIQSVTQSSVQDRGDRVVPLWYWAIARESSPIRALSVSLDAQGAAEVKTWDSRAEIVSYRRFSYPDSKKRFN